MEAFHYRHQQSFLHQADPRIKLVFFFVVQTLAAGSQGWFQAVLILALLGLAVLGKLRLATILLPAPGLWFFFLMIPLFRVFPWNPGDHLWQVSMMDAGILVLQLILILGFAQVFLACTSISSIRESLVWFLGPLPSALRWGLSLSTSLVFMFVPVIFDAAQDRHLAAINRGSRRKGRSLKARLSLIRMETLGILTHGLELAKDVELAIIARKLHLVPGRAREFDHEQSGRLMLLLEFCLALGFIVIVSVAKYYLNSPLW